MYLPKSKYKSGLYASLDTFVYKDSGEAYTGPYIETYLGKYLTGDTLTSLSRELIKIDSSDAYLSGVGNNIAVYRDRYDIIRENDNELALRATTAVPLYYPRPTNEKTLTRYFAIDKTNQRVVEVSKDTYLSMKSKEPKYYYPKYELKTLTWSLTSVSANRVNAAVAGLDSYLKDPSQFVR